MSATDATATDTPGGAVVDDRSPEAASDCVTIRDADAGAPTVLSFSAIGKPGQRPGRQFGGALARLDARVVFVQDPYNAGFQHGVPQLGDTFAEMSTALASLVPADSRRAGALAASVGAFGAVICGTMLGVERIVLFSPRVRISRDALETRMRRDPSLVPFDTTGSTTDLPRWLRENDHPPVDVHVGDRHALDCREAERMAGLAGVTVHTYPTDVHAVSRWLFDEGLLAPLLAGVLDLRARASGASRRQADA